MKQFRLDNYQSAVLGSRMIKARVTSVSAPFLYVQGGVFARIVDAPADKAMAGGFTVAGDDGTIRDEIDRLKVISTVAEALRWARLYGGACIVPVIADNKALADPLDYGGLERIEELRVYHIDQVSISGSLYSDATKPNFGQPEFYQISTTGGSFIVHESRLIPLPGDPMPQDTKTRRIYWQGRDAVTRGYKAVLEWEEARQRTKSIMERKQQAVFSMKGLGDLIAADMEQQVQQRINVVDSVRNILNTVAVDAEDGFNIIDLGLGGLTDIIGKFEQVVSAETGIPITVLFGESAKGLNATGEGDLRIYHELVEAERLRRAQPALERLISLIVAQRSIPGEPAESWRIEWPPLYTPTAKEAAEMKKLAADTQAVEMATLDKVVGMGAVSEEQAHEYLKSQRLFGLSEEAGSKEKAAEYAEAT